MYHRKEGDASMKIAVADKITSKSWYNEDIVWSELLKRFREPVKTGETFDEYQKMTKAKKAEKKGAAGCFVGGDLITTPGRRTAGNLKTRCLITLDADDGASLDDWDTATMMTDCAMAAYPTHSHTAEKPRLRWIIPLSRAVTPDEYGAISRKIAVDLGIMESLDPTTFRPAQAMFWPTCSDDAQYKLFEQDGPFLDPDEVLSRYEDWKDSSSWPVSARKKTQLEETGKEPQNPTEKTGFVGAFCRCYDIHSAISEFLSDVYLPTEKEDRYTYANGTTAAGLVVYDNGLFAYSNHATDPCCNGHRCNAFDLVRIHLFGDLDEDVEPETPITQYPSYKAMIKMAREDAAVRQNWARDDFSEKQKTVVQDLLRMAGGLQEKLEELKPNTNPRYPWTDIGNGNLFADCYKDICRYCPQRKEWMVFNGSVWVEDTGGLSAMRLCKKLADELAIYTIRISDENEERTRYLKFIQKWQIRRNRETVLKDARDLYPVRNEEFDRNPNLLNCENGTINLETLDFYPHRAEDMLTMKTKAAYDPDAKSTLWADTVSAIMLGNADNIQFLQRALGYSLLGENERERFFMCYGPTTRNGKGTVLNTITAMLGDYAIASAPEMIAQKTANFGSHGPTPDIARLAGKRFVSIGELPENMALNSALVKDLSGRTVISARIPYQKDPFDFTTDCRLWIATNYLPTVTDLAIFDSDRAMVIPFDRHFSEEERDVTLKSRLLDELSGILNWCLQGLELYREYGLTMPQGVRAATNDYRLENDKAGKFVYEYLEIDEDSELDAHEVYNRYVEWCGGKLKGGYSAWKKAMQKCDGCGRIDRKRPKGSTREATLRDFMLCTRWKRTDRD